MEENKSLATEESVAAEEVETAQDVVAEEVAVAEAAPVTEDVKKSSAGAKVKEWCRKKIVNLKRKPQNIPLLLYVVTSVVYLICLTTFSELIYVNNTNEDLYWTGLFVFINVLLSLLVLVSFLNSFPKRKKPNIFFIILTGAMTAAMLACDIVYYVFVSNASVGGSYASIADETCTITIAHIVLLAISALAFALLPVYSKLIRKIDTSIKVESATESMAAGSIDIQED